MPNSFPGACSRRWLTVLFLPSNDCTLSSFFLNRNHCEPDDQGEFSLCALSSDLYECHFQEELKISEAYISASFYCIPSAPFCTKTQLRERMTRKKPLLLCSKRSFSCPCRNPDKLLKPRYLSVLTCEGRRGHNQLVVPTFQN